MFPQAPIEHTKHPIVCGSSVVAVKYNGGVILGADTLASYGSMARYKGVDRLRTFGESTIIGGTGEMSDFQQVSQMVDSIDLDDWLHEDQLRLGPTEIYSYLGRVMYNRRTKGNPLYNQFVIAGHKNNEAFLGYIDHQGTMFQDKYIATGFGKHMSIPMLRAAWKPDMTEAEARALVSKCLEVLFYRDCYASNEVQLAKADASGVTVEDPIKLKTEWSFAHWNKPTSQVAIGASW